MCKYVSVSTYNKVERVPPKNFHLIFIYYLIYHINLLLKIESTILERNTL